MHTVACPDRIVHHSALNMKMKTFWSLNLDFYSDSVCNLLYTLQSSILFIHIWIWSCTVLKPDYMLHVGNTSNYIWSPSNHVYDYYSFIISFYNLSVVYSSLKDKLFSVPLECFCELKLSLVARFYGVTSSQVVITVTQCGDLGETRHRDLEHAKVSLHRSTTDSRISYSATGEN